jgi:arylsulfatase
MLYGRWWGEKLWTMVPAITIVGAFLATFEKYPPSQASGTFSVEKALRMLEEGSLKN